MREDGCIAVLPPFLCKMASPPKPILKLRYGMRFWRGMQIIFQPSTQTERAIVPFSSLIDGKFG